MHKNINILASPSKRFVSGLVDILLYGLIAISIALFVPTFLNTSDVDLISFIAIVTYYISGIIYHRHRLYYVAS